MVPEFKEDLFHLECGRQRFNEDGSSDSIVGDTEIGLRKEKDVVPETGLKIVLHLWKIKVGSGVTLDELLSVVVKIEGKVEEGGRHGDVVHRHAGLVEMPAPRSVVDVSQSRP